MLHPKLLTDMFWLFIAINIVFFRIQETAASLEQSCQQASQPAGSLRLAGWLDWLKTVGWLPGLVGLVLFLVLSFGVEFLLRLTDRPPIHIVHRVELLVGEAPHLISLIAAPGPSFSPPSRAVDTAKSSGDIPRRRGSNRSPNSLLTRSHSQLEAVMESTSIASLLMSDWARFCSMNEPKVVGRGHETPNQTCYQSGNSVQTD
jgi:hypothetical protein